MNTEIKPFVVGGLVTAAKQLAVTLEVDPDLLREEVKEFTEGYSTLALAVKSIVVNDDASYHQCLALRENAAVREKELTAIWKRYKDPLNAARKVVLDFEHQTVDPFTDVKDTASKKAEEYIKEQRRAAKRAEEALARAAAVTQADLNQKAEDLMLSGRIKEAEQVQMQAQMTVAPRLPSAIPRVAGAKVGEKYTARVMDILSFAHAVVSGEIELMQEVTPGDIRPILVVDQVVLNAVTKRQGTGLNWPGITVEEGFKISSNPGGK